MGLECSHKEKLDGHAFGYSNTEMGCSFANFEPFFLQLGKKLLSGHLNLINVSMPVKLFEPRSYLEKMTDVWVYPAYLKLAAEASDPVQRMQHVMTWSAHPNLHH